MKILVEENLSEGFLSNLFKKLRKNQEVKIPEESNNTLENYFKQINSIITSLKKVQQFSRLIDTYRKQFPKEMNNLIYSKGYSLEDFIESFYKLDEKDKSITLASLNSIQGDLRDLKKELDSNQYSTFLKFEIFLKK